MRQVGADDVERGELAGGGGSNISTMFRPGLGRSFSLASSEPRGVVTGEHVGKEPMSAAPRELA